MKRFYGETNNVSAHLKEKINEISMLLVMTGSSDAAGLELIAEFCQGLVKEATAPEHARLQTAAKYACEQIAAKSPSVMETLNNFATSAQLFLEGQSQAVFPNEEGVSRSSEAPAPAATAVVPSVAAAPVTQEPMDLGSYSITGEKDILVEFAAEAEEHLGNVEEIILDSGGSYTKESIDTIFRGVHSLKGGSAYFNLEEITKTSHLLENLLDEVRSDKRSFDEQLKNLVLAYIDLEKKLITAAKRASAGNGVIARNRGAAEFLVALKAYAEGKAAPATPVSTTTAPTPSAPTRAASPTPTVAPKAKAEEAEEAKGGDKGAGRSFVKIDTARLDQLIDSIGEMAIYSSMLVRMCREQLARDENVLKTTRQVEKFARDLQDIGMSMRLVPVKGLFQKMSRLVWDTSKKLGKDIFFSMEGEDTELDRNIIDKIADPLMHMVRNSIDHGVETPDQRIAAGKSPHGTVKLSACHSGGSIHIKIEDDGRGLDTEKLVMKAVEKGIIEEDAKLTEQEIFNLIFAPGFSTAAVVTDVSGRGVGMDVVRRNVESLRGHIHITSELGKGATFTIEIPLTLAMIDGIEIKVGIERFIIPSLSIVEFIRPDKKSLSSTLDRGETFYFRGKYLPIFRLSELYGIQPEFSDPTEATLIVVENNQEHVAIMVDDIVGEYSTVIKSLSAIFPEGKGVSGCAIMPDGSVALILDVRHLVALARSTSRRVQTPKASVPQADAPSAVAGEQLH